MTAANAKMSVLVICVEVIIYLLLYNLNECTFKSATFIISRNTEISFLTYT